MDKWGFNVTIMLTKQNIDIQPYKVWVNCK